MVIKRGGFFKLNNMNKTAMAEMIEWLQSYEYEIPLELQVKAKELLEKEKQQIIDAYVMGSISLTSRTEAEDYYNQTYQNK